MTECHRILTTTRKYLSTIRKKTKDKERIQLTKILLRLSKIQMSQWDLQLLRSFKLKLNNQRWISKTLFFKIR